MTRVLAPLVLRCIHRSVFQELVIVQKQNSKHWHVRFRRCGIISYLLRCSLADPNINGVAQIATIRHETLH
jgi:hypothetical protein